MQNKQILLMSILLLMSNAMFCNYFPMDEIACITKTDGIKCHFNDFQNACVETLSTNHGCKPSLNKMACLSQLTNPNGSEAKCYFQKKCVVARSSYLKGLGCSVQFSRSSCTNVLNKNCFWNGAQCELFQGEIPQSETCETVFGNSVTASLCSQIKNLKCYNGGFSGDYKCQTISEVQLSQLMCNTPGLSESGCLAITTIGQACIFENLKCQSIVSSYPTNCSQSLNRLACLSITNPKVQCQWQKGQCQVFNLKDQLCDQITDINPSVCSNFKSSCKFDNVNLKCIKPTSVEKLTCNTQGLTKEDCLQIKNDYCTYFNGVCEQLKVEDLSFFQCNMLLNEDACVNITTEFQFCKWNGTQCSRMTINQDINCPVDLDTPTTKFNGNVCQAITKPEISCKYNSKTHRCVQSLVTDDCEALYLNLFGCVSIQRAGSGCQWTLNGCINATIIKFKTTCASLEFANYIACSQVYEDSNTGCYYNSSLQQCQKIDLTTQAGIDIMNQLECSNSKLGLNKVACASITTDGQICRWYQNQCSQIKRKVDVAQIPCINMQFVNQYACGLVESGKEPCRYLKKERGCVNSVSSTMTCSDPGLNTYACAKVSGDSCYYDTTLNQCKKITIPTGSSSTSIPSSSTSSSAPQTATELLSTMECEASSPTEDVCKSIVTIGQLCSWSKRATVCQNQIVVLNQSCATYSGSQVVVNANVCASIEMEFPDYDYRYNKQTDTDRGYCKFNKESGNCEKNGDTCTTPCCTEKVGINAHSCSRFSTQTVGIYCYFGNDLRCSQLTSDQVDITQEGAVKSYYNANYMRCSQMNRNSCHMISWSTKQLCYHNGNVCVNVNFSNYPNLDIFVQYPAILNENACLAIEAQITNKNNLKYFQYDSVNRRCQLIPSAVTNYSTCGAAIGNRNVCLRYTGSTYCKWDSSLLKCVDIPDDEFAEIYTCSYNQNLKACIENQNTACQFSYTNDRCIDAPTNVPCNYFNAYGPVSSAVCARITMDQQMCEFGSNNTCVTSDNSSNNCDVTGANSNTCYNNTQGKCRWDSINYVCYDNQDDITTLGCEDNLNNVLCLLVTKEPCAWDVSKYKCVKFTITDASNINQSNSYNQLACYAITGGSYYFSGNKCLNLTEYTKITCQKYFMNKQACLLNTQGYLCYYDETENIPNHRCKPFTGDQTVCKTNTLISIDVCMHIPAPCYFNTNTLDCVSVIISDTQTCSNLKAQTANGNYYNRMSCVSVSEFLDSTDTAAQCYQVSAGVAYNNYQQCNYQKYCVWSAAIRTCDIPQLTANLTFAPAYDVQKKDSNGDPVLDDNGEPVIIHYPAVCSGVPIPVAQCSNYYAKALCLQYVTEQCYFDINQGGCIQFSGNEQKLSDCTTIVKTCNGSATKGVICQQLDTIPEISPGLKCYDIKNPITKCINDGSVPATYLCAEITNHSRVVCAGASDDCRFNGTKCTNSPGPSSTDNNNKITYTCDNSMSQSMCETYKCDYTFLGYCQQTKLPPVKTSDNKYFLCYEVNLLKTEFKAEVCASVDQACIYTNKCNDATGSSCSALTNSIVSSKACLSCDGSSMQYDILKFKCVDLSSSKVEICENLNKQACLLNTTKKGCKWSSNTCVFVDTDSSTTTTSDDITSSDTNCSTFNSVACPFVKNNCFVDTTGYCSIFNPSKATCANSTSQTTCTLSNSQACQWVNNACVTPPDLTKYSCDVANKYGCLNMTDKYCGWSDENSACFVFDFQSTISSCDDFVDTSNNKPNNKLTNFNDLTCSFLIVQKACFRDNQYRCRQKVSADVLKCDTPGVNQYACINKTIGQCQFLEAASPNFSKCTTVIDTKIGCKNTLNVYACINQEALCQFKDSVCQTYNPTIIKDITTYTTPYSMSACSSLDEKIIDEKPFVESIVYSQEKLRCVSATARSPFISDCTQKGINKFACLNKTTTFCQYSNKQCLSITKNQLLQATTCDPTYNWYSCITLSLKCKFQNNLCAPVDILNTTPEIIETCANLQTSGALVSAQVCQTRTDDACRLNTLTNKCEIVSSSQVCTQSGLNKKGCILYTTGSICKYVELEDKSFACSNNYQNASCTDLVNSDKCYSIKTPGQYCKFNSICENVASTVLAKCEDLKAIQTNPVACSQSTDYACFYDIKTKMCIPFTNNNSNSNLYDWSNSVSLNQKACILYNQNFIPTYWSDNQCQKIPNVQYNLLKCSDLVNVQGCKYITTSGQFCTFIADKCQAQDLSAYASKACDSIVNINSPAFCEVVTADVKCAFDSTLSSCVILTQNPTDCESKGYNKKACESNPLCQFNLHCYKKPSDASDKSKLFCKDASDVSDCVNVVKEGCDLACQSIGDYNAITCDKALNQFGCTRITKAGQFCQYDSNKCNFTQPELLKTKKCTSIKYINNYQYCEQPTDVACIYDQDQKSCVAVGSNAYYDCNRGLNELACLNQTTATLKCQFFNYCYGPNSGLSKCVPSSGTDCCTSAVNKESCLFQTKYSCQWDNVKCSKFTVTPTNTCDSLTNKSRNVCTSVNNSICVFDATNFKCKALQPTTCDQVQTNVQCQQLENIPCIWDDSVLKCVYKTKQNYDECQDIKNSFGNKLACTMVERVGQMCKFDTQCVTFIEDSTGNNCLDNINKVSCTQQVYSYCQWETQTIKIKQTQWSNESDLLVGGCTVITDFNVECNDNLSYLSCLKVNKTGSQCIWLDGSCQQIVYLKNDKFTISQLVLVNSNACGLINNGDMVQYQENMSACAKIIDNSGITCSPLIPGINKTACLKIKNQKCKWDDDKKICVFAGNRLLLETKLQPYRLLTSACQQNGTGPQLCSQITLEMPCGATEDGCDSVDLNTAVCDDNGINKYACLNLNTSPCAWVLNDDSTTLHHCEEYYPYTSCASIPSNVNYIVCSYAEDDACVYNPNTKSCQTPTLTYTQCNVPGINSIACSKISGCIFINQECILQDVNQNLLCADAAKANSAVCQLAIDRCKYSTLTSGCITSTITDNCSTQGLSAIGCNVLDACQWSNNQCQCIAYLNKYPDCSTISSYNDCINTDYCFFEVAASNASKDITQYLKNTNYGTCRLKICSDLDVNKCNSYALDSNICYLTSNQKCQLATKCEDIVGPSKDCTTYTLNNKPCKNSANNVCQTLNCATLDEKECGQFTTQCVFVGYCKIRSCDYIKDQSICQQNNCDWNIVTQKCQIQLLCSRVTTGDACVAKKQIGAQCAWIPTTDSITECTATGCRYLGKTQGECMGTQIGNDVCVQMVDFSCVSCEEITDACVCLNQKDYCSYDRITQKCSSYSCQSHNQTNCPTTRCYFNKINKICLPLCQYNYNSIQCNQADQCIWDSNNSICITYTPIVEPVKITLPSPNYGTILQIMIIIIL